MKLTFPNGEHGQVMLSDGVNRIGSAPDAQVRLNLEGIAPVHCELQLAAGIVTVRVPDPSNPVTLNGKVVQGVMAVRSGDQLGVGPVQARLVAVDKAGGVASIGKSDTDADSGATRMRMAVPKFVLRGVSGPAFGTGSWVVGFAALAISMPGATSRKRMVSRRSSSPGLSRPFCTRWPLMKVPLAEPRSSTARPSWVGLTWACRREISSLAMLMLQSSERPMTCAVGTG
jgi:hypothetical protein